MKIICFFQIVIPCWGIKEVDNLQLEDGTTKYFCIWRVKMVSKNWSVCYNI